MLAALLGVTVAGCNSDRGRPLQVVVIGDRDSLFAAGAKLPYSAQLVRSATAEGLVGFDEQGRVVPALADRWIVTDDGQSFIFRLRDGKWPDGTRISGDTARAALQQALAGLRGTALGQDLAVIADVRTMAGRVIEVRLVRPFPDLLQLLAQPELGLLRDGRGAGPMRLKRDGRTAVLSALPPAERGVADEEDWASHVRLVRLGAYPAAAAMEKFNSGEADIVLGGRIEDFPRIDSSGFSRGAIRLDPVAGLFGLAVVRPEGFLAEPEYREALAMAIDREALLAPFNLSGWTATTRVITPGLEGDTGSVTERWPGQSLAERQTAARGRVERWEQANGQAVVRIALPRGPGGELLFKRIAEDLEAIGITSRRVDEGAAADLRLVDAVARYPRPTWFLNQLSCTNVRGACSPTADKRVAQALTEPDPAVRAELLAQAEADLTLTNYFIPFGVPVRWSLLSGNASGFAPNGWNVHPLIAMAMLPK
jgi:peptide/nickel transport system substrate-binding protein/oligopeptide transport system substrate-binding protein